MAEKSGKPKDSGKAWHTAFVGIQISSTTLDINLFIPSLKCKPFKELMPPGG